MMWFVIVIILYVSRQFISGKEKVSLSEMSVKNRIEMLTFFFFLKCEKEEEEKKKKKKQLSKNILV